MPHSIILHMVTMATTVIHSTPPIPTQPPATQDHEGHSYTWAAHILMARLHRAAVTIMVQYIHKVRQSNEQELWSFISTGLVDVLVEGM